jgi:hypothetical protein
MNTVRYASRSAVSFSIQKPLVPNIAENISYVTTNWATTKIATSNNWNGITSKKPGTVLLMQNVDGVPIG